MQTSDFIAPGGSTVLFSMAGIVHAYEPLAAGFDVEKTKNELFDFGDEMNCDISMEDLWTGAIRSISASLLILENL